MSVSPSSRTFHQTASPSVFSFSKLDAGSPTGTAVGNGPENANPDSVMSLTSTETLRVPGVLKAVQRLKERQARNNRRDLGKGRSKSVSPAKSRSGPPPFHQTTQIPHNGNAGLGTGGTNPNDSTETDTDVEQEHNRIAAAFAENAEARRLAGERVAEAQIGAKKKAYTKIAIIGAGPVGLWLALLLCRSYYPKGKEHVLQNQIAAGFFDGKKKKRSKSSGDTNLGGKSQSGPAKADEDAIASKQKNPEDERTVVEDLENLLHITPNTIQQGTASQSSSSTFDASRMNKVMPPLMISSSRPQSRAAPAAQRASTPAKRTKTGANGSDENEAHLHTPSPSKGTTASERGASSASTTSPGKSKISFADAAKLVVTNSDNERSGMGRSRGFSVSVSPSKFAAKTYGSNPESNSLLKIHIYEKRPLKSHATRNILLALSTQTESLLYRNMTKATHAWSPCAPLADLEKSLRQELEKFWWPCVKFHWDSAVDLDEKVFSKLQTKCEESWYDHKVVENVGNQLQVEKDENEFLMFDDDALEKTAELLEQTTTLPSFSSAKAKLLANGARNPAFGAGAGCGSTGSAALNALRANNSASLVDSDAESISRGFEIDGNTFDAAFICSGKSAVSHLHKKMNITKATILSYRKKGAVVPKELKEKLKAEQAAAAGGAEGVEKQEQSSISEFRSIQDRKYNNPLLRSENIIIRELGTYGWVWLLRYEKPIVKRRMPAAGKAKDSKQADAGGGGGNSPTNGSRKANKASGGQKSGLVDADAMCDEQQHQATKRPTKAQAEQEEQENEDPDGDQEKQDASAASAIDELKEHLEATAQPTPVNQFSTFAEMTSNVDNLDDPDALFAALEGSIDYEKAFGISVNVTEANHWGLRLAPRRDRDVSPNRMQTSSSPKRGTAGGGGIGGEQSQRKNSPSPSAKSGSPKRNGSVSPPGARGRGGGAGAGVQGMIGGASSVLNSGVLPDVVVALPRGGRAKAKEESDSEQKNDTVICFAGDALCGKPFYLGTTLQFHLHDMNFLVSNVNWTKGSALSAKDFRAYESRMRDTIQGFLTQKNNSIAKPVGGGGSSPSGKAKNADGTPAKTPRAGAVAASGAKTSTTAGSSAANASLTTAGASSSPPQHQRIAGSSATSSSSASGGASEQDGRKERESTPGVVSIPKVSMLAVGAPDGKVTEESCAAEEESAETTTSCLIAPPASPEAVGGASARASLQLVNKTNVVSGISNSAPAPAQQQGRSQHASGGNRPGTPGGGDNDVDSVPDAAEWSGGENGDVGSCGSGAHSSASSGAVAGLQGALGGSRGAGGKTKVDLVSSLSGTTTVGETTDEHSCTSSSSASSSSSSSRADPGRGAAARRSGSGSNLEQSTTTAIGHPPPTAALGNGSSGSVSTPGSSAGTGNKARSLSSISVVDPAAMGSGETSSSSASSSSEAAQADAHAPPALGYAGAHPARPVTAKEVLDQIIEARNTKHVPAKWIGSYSSSSSAASASKKTQNFLQSSESASSRIRTGAEGGSSPSGVTGTAGLTGQGHPSTPMAKARARVSSIFAAAGGGGASPSAGRGNPSATSVPGDYVDDDRREVMNRRALAIVNDRCEHPTQLMEEYERQKEKSDFSNSITRGRPSPTVFASNRAAFGSGNSAFADAFNLNGAARSPLGGADAEGGAVISGSAGSTTTGAQSQSGTAAGARGSVISRHGLKMGMSGDLMKDLLLPTREAGGVAGESGSPGKNRIRALSDLTATESRQLADDDPIHRRNEDFLSQFFVKR